MIKKLLYRISHWETWHWVIKYIPITPAWAWYCLRSGNPWFFSTSNPSLRFGGFVGEAKREMYRQLPPSLVPRSIYISPQMSFRQVEQLYEKGGFSFPVAVKPDVGMMGYMFRKIENMSHLRQYHDVMPVDYIIQDLVEFPMEVSVFYYRNPNSRKGKITGFVKKESLEVTGDGQSTLIELIQKYPRATYRLDELKSKHEKKLNDVMPAGEVIRLSHAMNLSRGGKLVSLAAEKDDRLLKMFDGISHYTDSFYYGRYDIKCQSVEDLKQGKNFTILEFNGAGAEPHHVYGNHYTLFRACLILLQHWHALYKISRYNHKNKELPYWNYSEGVDFAKRSRKHYLKLRELDTLFYFDRPVIYAVDRVTPSLAGF